MSRRFGWVIIAEDLKPRELELLRDFRESRIPIQRRKEKASDHMMWKVNDDLELCIGYGKRFTLLQGQFDLGITPPGEIDELCRKYSKGGMALWLSVEGTSENYQFRKFKDGALAQSYGSSGGCESKAECPGQMPLKNEYGQVGDWELVNEVEREGICVCRNMRT